MRFELRSITLGKLTEFPHPNESERLIARPTVCDVIDAATDQAYERHPTRCRRISDRGFATGGIPPQHSRLREPHTREMRSPLAEFNTPRRPPENVSAPIRVENLIGPLEEMCERLTVVAITDTSIATLGRDLTQHAAQSTTGTSNGKVDRRSRWDRGSPSRFVCPRARSQTESPPRPPRR